MGRQLYARRVAGDADARTAFSTIPGASPDLPAASVARRIALGLRAGAPANIAKHGITGVWALALL